MKDTFAQQQLDLLNETIGNVSFIKTNMPDIQDWNRNRQKLQDAEQLLLQVHKWLRVSLK